VSPAADPEDRAREVIDAQLQAAGWHVCNRDDLDLVNHSGVAVREVVMKPDHGKVDYLLYVDRRSVGVIEAKPEGTPLSGVQWQSAMYAEGLPQHLCRNAVLVDGRLPFVYEASGSETRFTNGFDPEPRARYLSHFQKPETLARLVRDAESNRKQPNWRHRVRTLPPFDTYDLRPASKRALGGVEISLAVGRDRSLVQMATGAGKTRMAVTQCYRLLRYAGAKRVLFLVDRNNLGDQTLREFRDFATPDDGRKFTDLYNVDKLRSAGMVQSSDVVISTIQRVYAALQGKTVVDEDDQDVDNFRPESAVNVAYSSQMPPESFDLIIVDECHRSIFGVWRGVLEYFSAHIVGLTATPDKRAFGFFEQNLVSEYTYQESVLDGVNVDFDVYRIKTEVTDHGGKVEAGATVPVLNVRTRQQRLETMEGEVPYGKGELDRSVTNPNQIRLVLKTFHDRLFTEIFPGRKQVPKTLIYAKDDNHAEFIVDEVRKVFGKGNDFAAKITYSARDPKELLQKFRNSPTLRIAVTVDMIATGTDVRPLECVFFMRDVRSGNYFEQMKGRGCRSIDDATFQTVTEDAVHKERFVIVDAVGVTEHDFVDATPTERVKTQTIESLFEKAANFSITPDETASLGARLARIENGLNESERKSIVDIVGRPLREIANELVLVDNPERILVEAEKLPRKKDGSLDHDAARIAIVSEVIVTIAGSAPLRRRINELRRAHEKIIDDITPDKLLGAGGVVDYDKARQVVQSWKLYLEENRDEITALQIAYAPGQQPQVTYELLKNIAGKLRQKPYLVSVDLVWAAYLALEASKVKQSPRRTATDLISLVRYTLQVERELVPFSIRVEERYVAWLEEQRNAGVEFTETERWWLDRIKDAIIQGAHFKLDDLAFAPFADRGGIDGAGRDLGVNAKALIDQLNLALAA